MYHKGVKNMRRKCVLYISAFATIIIVFFCSSCNNDIPFNSKRWNNPAQNDDLELRCRYNMVNDLIQKKLLVGKNKNQIIKLLGEDTEVVEEIKPNELAYTILIDYGFDIDPVKMVYLVICLKNSKYHSHHFRTYKNGKWTISSDI